MKGTPGNKSIGFKYGKLTVVRVYSNGHRSIADCLCDCGNTHSACISNIRRFHVQSCGCLNKKGRAPRKNGRTRFDLTSQVFGLWTAVSEYGPGKTTRQILWNCRCACGSEQRISATDLRNGSRFGCRACRAQRQLKTAKVAYWNYMKCNAKYRDKEVSVSADFIFDLLEKQEYKCALTGEPIHIALGRRSHMHGGTTASVDRIDSKQGYIPGNVWWVHKDVNKMKSDLLLNRLVDLCGKIQMQAVAI